MRMLERIRRLEREFIKKPVILHFADGRTEELHGRGNFVVSLLRAANRKQPPNSAEAEQLDMIRRSTSSEEPGGARMIEFIRVILQAREDVDGDHE
jgi:hypothetical protein